MYTKSVHTLGKQEVHTYKNNQTNNSISIVPGMGALVNELILLDQSIIDGADSSEIDQNPAYKSTVLAPFPNRTADGKYSFNGKSYQLPINEPAANNALHGFIYNRPFTITEETLKEDGVSVILEHEYQGDFPGYPFPFSIQFKIELSDISGLSCILSAVNTGSEDIPFGYGWHPYFKFDCSVDELEVKLPTVKKYLLTNTSIPTGDMTDFPDFKELTLMKGKTLDDCFKIISTNDIVETVVRKPSERFELIVWQENSKNTNNYLQVYTPPTRQSVAIEPMTSCINAFNNGYGLLVLKPNEKTQAGFGVTLRKY